MRPAGVAQVIERAGGAGGEIGVQVLVVEDAQRVDAQPSPGVMRQALLVSAEVVDQRGAVRGATDGVADRVDVGDHVANAALGVEALPQLDDLGVDHRSGIADRLDIPLHELPEAACLWTVVAEHRADQPHALRPRSHVHAVLQVGAHDPRRRLRAECPLCPLLLAAGRAADPEHLLLDRVGRLAQTAAEELDPLEERRLDAVEGVPRAQVAGDPLDPAPGGAILGEQVARAAGRGDGAGHARESTGGVCRGPARLR